jgi:alkylated DNA nucleotide flippase Atl1
VTNRSEELAGRILACVESIPTGRVMTYGDVAEYAGASTPRIVGRVLARVDLAAHRWDGAVPPQ